MDAIDKFKSISDHIDRLEKEKFDLQNQIKPDFITHFLEKIYKMNWTYQGMYDYCLTSKDVTSVEYQIALTIDIYNIPLNDDISIDVYERDSINIFFKTFDKFIEFVKQNKVSGRVYALEKCEELKGTIKELEMLSTVLEA